MFRFLRPLLSLCLMAPGFLLGACDGKSSPADSSPEPCGIIVTQPAAGDRWLGDRVEYIRWQGEGGSGQVRIELWRGDALILVIRESTPNDGSTSWTATTAGQPTAADYRIKVSDELEAECQALSEFFTLVNPLECQIEVTSPIEGVDWERFQEHNITWNSASTSGRVRIELRHGQQLVGEIVNNTPDDGILTWPVTSFNQGTASGYHIRIVDALVGDCSGLSPWFRITDPSPCWITLTSPTAGDAWSIGQRQTITWDHEHDHSWFVLTLRKGGEYLAEIDAYVVDVSSYSWTVSTHGAAPGDDYQIMVADRYDRYCVGVSSVFTIQE